MKNKEMGKKLKSLVSKTTSKWVEESDLRIKNKKRLLFLFAKWLLPDDTDDELILADIDNFIFSTCRWRKK